MAGSAGARSASFCSQLRALVTRAHGRSSPALRRSPCDSGHGDDCWDEAACSGGDAEDGQTSREEAPTGCGCRQKRLARGDATRFVHGTVEPARHSCAAPPPTRCIVHLRAFANLRRYFMRVQLVLPSCATTETGTTAQACAPGGSKSRPSSVRRSHSQDSCI